MITEEEIEQIYIDLVNEYGRKLPAADKDEAKIIFTDLLDKGFSFEWLYWALWNLGERELIKNKGLLYYKDYQDEVYSIANKARSISIQPDITLEEMINDLDGMDEYNRDEICDTDIEVIQNYIYRYYTCYEFNSEEIKEIQRLYIDNYIKPGLRITKKFFKEERQGVIEQLKDANIYVDYKEIPYHIYMD